MRLTLKGRSNPKEIFVALKFLYTISKFKDMLTFQVEKCGMTKPENMLGLVLIVSGYGYHTGSCIQHAPGGAKSKS